MGFWVWKEEGLEFWVLRECYGIWEGGGVWSLVFGKRWDFCFGLFWVGLGSSLEVGVISFGDS